MTDDFKDAKPTDDEAIITEAKERFEYWQGETSAMLQTMEDDLLFSDPTNPQQWPEEMRKEREGRPTLTFDRTNQFKNQVLNDARQNKPAVKYLPADDQGDPKLAEILAGITRHNDYLSNASSVFMTAHEYQVTAGLGYMRIIVVDADKKTGTKRTAWRRVNDIKSIVVDPDYLEPDGSDMQWGGEFRDLPKRTFKRKYPKADMTDFESLGTWVTKETIRVFEYYRLVPGPESLICEHFLLTGSEILERTVFPCAKGVDANIPIVPVHGNEIWINGKRRLGGIIARVKGPQMAYNFERSSYVEKVALAPKAPFIASVRSIQGLEPAWSKANRSSASYLPFNDIDPEGNPISAPQRQQAAQMESGWQAAAQQSLGDISAGFGMFEANLGAPSNETSGKAILARQHEGDTATFNFVDNLRHSIEHGYKIMLNAQPVLLDVKQIHRILGEDNESSFVTVNPDQPEAYLEGQNPQGLKQISINPNIGKYDLLVTTAPGFATRQQEAAAAMSEMINGNPQMFSMIGDIYVKTLGMPEGDKISNRLKLMLPPQIQQAEENDQEDPKVLQVKAQAQQAMDQQAQQMQQMQDVMQKMHEEIQQKDAELQNKDFQMQKAAVQAEIQKTLAAKKELEMVQKQFDATKQQGDDEHDQQIIGAIAELNQKLMLLEGQQAQHEQVIAETVEEKQEEASTVDAIQQLTQQFAEAMNQSNSNFLAAMESVTEVLSAPKTVVLPSGKSVTVQSSKRLQ